MHAQHVLSYSSPSPGRQGWWGMPWAVAILAALGLALATAHSVQAKTFHCRAGDVACIIAAINDANASGEKNTITLAAGLYTLTTLDNEIDGLNGLPSIHGTLTIKGAGALQTIVERPNTAPAFRHLHVSADGALTLEGLTLRGGLSDFGHGGGAVWNAGTLKVQNCRLLQNEAPYSGGAIANIKTGQLHIDQSTLADNMVGNLGGAVVDEGTSLITRSSLVRNQAFFEGGAMFTDGGNILIINSTIARNISQAFDGAISAFRATVHLLSSTVAENQAVISGGVSNFQGVVKLRNTILAGNRAAIAEDCSGVLTSLDYNWLGSESPGCSFESQPHDHIAPVTLGTFLDNPLPGRSVIPLIPGSPLINAGPHILCPRQDQLGNPRKRPCDIGAIEFQGDDPAVASLRE
jgi:hypothetical protein